VTGREFDPKQADGPIRQLSTRRIKVTHRGIDAVERHISRFGYDVANQVMVNRLHRERRDRASAMRFELLLTRTSGICSLPPTRISDGCRRRLRALEQRSCGHIAGLSPAKTRHRRAPQLVPSRRLAFPSVMKEQYSKEIEVGKSRREDGFSTTDWGTRRRVGLV